MRESAQRITMDSQENRPFRPQSQPLLSPEARLHCLQQLVCAQSMTELLTSYGRQVATLLPGCRLLSASGPAIHPGNPSPDMQFRHQVELSYRGNWLTTLEYGNPVPLCRERQQLLEQLQQLLAPVLQQQRQLEHMQQLAQCDSLTGLYNRRHFEEQLERAINQCRRQQSGLALMIIDLDHFKQINDAHGHLCGDHVLCQVADALRTSIRSSDSGFRLGGDEFAVLLSPATECSAIAVEQRLKYNCTQLPHLQRHLGGISIGAALWQANEEWGDLYQRADRVLYQRKQSRQNG